MRFNKILHPEIILNRRGDSDLRRHYKKLLPTISYYEVGGFYVGEDMVLLDENTRSHFLLAYKFKHESGRVYHSGADFLLALSQVDKKLPIEYFPEKLMCYFSFAPGVIFDGEEEVQGAYVYIGDARKSPLRPEAYGKKIFWISYVTVNSSFGHLIAELKSEKMSDIIAKEKTKDFKYDNPGFSYIHKGSRNEVYRLVMNLCLYLASEGAEFLDLVPMINESSNKKNKFEKQNGHVNECSLPITLLSWSYCKQRDYVIESTWIETFPRWQPCGPNFSQIKLVWVKGHERHYSKGINNEKP